MTTYYIKTDGNDNLDGLTVATAWKKFDKANATVIAGDTVKIRSGNYRGQKIAPGNSGSQGSPITYIADTNQTPVMQRNQYCCNSKNTDWIVIDGITFDGETARGQDSGSWKDAGGVNYQTKINQWMDLSGVCYWLIQNCTFQYCWGPSGLRFHDNSQWNRVLSCTFSYCGTLDNGDNFGDRGDSVSFKGDSKYNLIDSCTFDHGGHNHISHEGRFNVISNNSFNNDWSDDPYYTSHPQVTTRAGQRIASLKGKGPPKTGYALFENNDIYGCGDALDASSTGFMKVSGNGYILRSNYVWDCVSNGMNSGNGSAVSYDGNTQNCRIYHNSIYDVGGEAWITAWNNSNGVSNEDHVFKNNLVFSCGSTAGTTSIRLGKTNVAAVDDNLVEYNLFYESDGGANVTVQSTDYTLTQAQTTFSSNFQNNLNSDPTLASATPASKADFVPQGGSPCIDAGAPLTYVNGAGGTGTVIPLDVGGTYYFFGKHASEGVTIYAGEQIKIGSDLVRVVAVNHGGNEITIDSSITWADDDPVSLDYGGSAPDIGAHQVDSSEVTTKTINFIAESFDTTVNDFTVSVTPNVIIPFDTKTYTHTTYDFDVKIVDTSGEIFWECCDGTFETDPDNCPAKELIQNVMDQPENVLETG